MHFAAPVWLALLLPWGAMTGWLLWVRRGAGAQVPFLELWRGPVTPSRSVGWFQLPPLALLALIVAMLLALLAAGRPVLPSSSVPARTAAAAPAIPKANVAITHVAAVDRPRAQVMVTVRNQSSDQRSGSLEIRSGSAAVRKGISLPPRGREANVFVDLPQLAHRVELSLDVGDEIAQDNRAVLERRIPPPRVEVRGDVPPEVRRVMEAYSRARPPAGEGGRVVAAPASEGEAGVMVASASGSAPRVPGDVRVVAHPVTANLDITKTLMSVSSASPPGLGWTTLVAVEGKPIVAVRESPVRQVWIGFESPELAVTPAFVVLWTNVIDWVGESDVSSFVATVMTAPTGSATPPAADAPASERPDKELAPILSISALLCVFFASLRWSSGRRLTAFSPPRTVI